MILNIDSDVSYLSEPQAKSRVAGHFFRGEIPQDKKPIMTNGNIFNVCAILKFVVCSAAEAELGALFIHAKAGKIVCPILQELDYPKSSTYIHCDNKISVGVGTLPNGYTKLSALPRVNPKSRVNPRLNVSQVKPHDESPTYRSQLALQHY